MTGKALLAFACVACLAGVSPAAGKGGVSPLRGLMDETKQLAKLRDVWAAKLPAAKPNSFDDGCLEIVIQQALYGRDLRVRLIRRGGKWTDGRARSSWTPHVCEADGSGLKMDGGVFSGELKVGVVVWARDQGVQQNDGQIVPCTYKIKAPLVAGEIQVTATLANSESAPFESRSRTVQSRWISAGNPDLRVKQPDGLGGVFDEAVRQVDRAHMLYEQIRALQLEIEQGIPYAVGKESVARWRVSYEKPEVNIDGKVKKKVRKKGRKGNKGRTQAVVPSLDDEDAIGGLGEVGESAETKAREKAQEAAVAKVLNGMLAHVTELRSVVGAAGQAKPPAVQVGDVDTGDPDFGPFSEFVRLERGKGAAHILPDDVGKPGRQSWPYLSQWDVLGPFPQSQWMSQTTVLPDILPDTNGVLLAEVDCLHGFGRPGGVNYGKYYGNGKHKWTPVPADPKDGMIIPPNWMVNKKYPWPGKDWGAYYAAAELVAPRDIELWAAAAMCDSGAIWVNNAPVWRSGPVPDWCDVNVFRFRMPLKKGSNRILVRCENRSVPHTFALRVCTAGKPRPKAEAAAAVAAVEKTYETAGDPLEGTLGWRRNQTGRFPGVKPVLAWDLDKRINVLWRTPLLPSNGGIMSVDGKVFTLIERVTLVCLNAADGKVLWKHDLDPVEFKAPDLYEEAKRLKKIRLESKDKKAVEASKTKLTEIYRKHGGFGWDRLSGFTGMAMTTPITDGKLLWVKMGTQVIGCFSFDGKVRWKKLTGAHGGQMGGPVSSPVLLKTKAGRQLLVCQLPKYTGRQKTEDMEDGKVDVEVVDRRTGGGPHPDRHPGRQAVLKAWDAATGEEIWETDRYVMKHFGNRYDADGIATPAVVRVTDGKDTMDVIYTTGGRVFRADDGKLLHRYVGSMNMCATPINDGRGTIFTTMAGWSGIRLIMVNRDTLNAEIRWKHRGGWKGWSPYGGWVFYGGQVHGYWTKRFGSVGAFDPYTGYPTMQYNHIFRYQTGHSYPPPTMAGEVLFVADDERCGYNKNANWRNATFKPEPRLPLIPACMSAVALDPEPLVLARNTCEGMSMAPWFEDDRFYIRSRKSVVCFGPTGEEGKRYETEVIARTVLGQMQLPEPDDTAPVEVPRLKGLPYEYSPGTLRVGVPFTHWNVVKGVTPDKEKQVSKGLGFPAGTKIAQLTKKSTVPDLGSNSVLQCSFEKEHEYPPSITTENARYGVTLDLTRVHKGEAGSVALWSTILHNPLTRTVRLELDSPHAEFYVGGKRIEHHRRVRLPHGNYVFSMRTVLPKGDGPVTIRPRLWPSNDVRAERERRLARLRQARPYLERAQKQLPGTDIAKLAAEVLAAVK